MIDHSMKFNLKNNKRTKLTLKFTKFTLKVKVDNFKVYFKIYFSNYFHVKFEISKKNKAHLREFYILKNSNS